MKLHDYFSNHLKKASRTSQCRIAWGAANEKVTVSSQPAIHGLHAPIYSQTYTLISANTSG